MSDEALLTPAEMKFKLDMQHEVERMVWEAMVSLIGDLPKDHPNAEAHTDHNKKFINRLTEDYDFQYGLANNYSFRDLIVRTLIHNSEFQRAIASIVSQTMSIQHTNKSTVTPNTNPY